MMRPLSRSRSRDVVVVCALVSGAVASGCLTRDVSTQQPTTKTTFETVVPQPAIDKVDVLVMVDSSNSMADKQRILADAVPDLLKGLVQPKCVEKGTRKPTGVSADPLAPEAEMCPAGSEPAFTPITDMHIGIVSSSLGGMGSSSCPTAGDRNASPRNDDHGRLVAFGPDGKNLPEAGDYHFLAWYPDVVGNANKQRHPDPLGPKITGLDALGKSFRDLVTGVGQTGCGYEAQLESVHRFLAQPDPWVGIQKDADGHASFADGVDMELLRQRAAFLRPDSLVAVILLTDEDDSSADPLSFRGTGWRFMEQPKTDDKGVCSGCLPRPTAACATRPADPACTSCAFAPNDPACVNGGVYGITEDKANVRFYRMKQRFGVDPQFPIERYVDALKKPRVSSRAAEHAADGTYAPKNDCINPLFAKNLPTKDTDERCRLERGPRSDSLVYFAIIGGVPNALLPAGTDPNATIDWTRILGADPKKWDDTGIDPRMLPSTSPRPGLPPPTAANDADPSIGREWTTNGDDLEYACTFDLYERGTDGKPVPTRRTASDDCDGKKDSPLCAKDDPKVQVKGKAYPTRRELLLAKELGDQAVVASLCPKQLQRPDDDDYGYRPAVRAITDRLARGLFGSCVPRKLETNPDNSVECIVTALLPDPGPDADCERLYGLGTPDPSVAAKLREKLVTEEGPAAGRRPICEVPQLPVPKGATCKDEGAKTGFCYVETTDNASCSYALVFSKPAADIVGARFNLQCIQQSATPAR